VGLLLTELSLAEVAEVLPRSASTPMPQFFGPIIHPLFHLSPSAGRIKLSVARTTATDASCATFPYCLFLTCVGSVCYRQLSLRLLLFRQHPDHECDQLLKRLEVLGLV
jgi:hypothetical protein